MNIYSKKQRWKYFIIIGALIIGISSLLYTENMVSKLAKEERKKVELWAEATSQLGNIDETDKDFNFLVQIIQNNETVPVILTNKEGDIISYRNLDTSRINNNKYLARQLQKMKEKNEPIEIHFGKDNINYIYYNNSIILTQLSYFPYIQLAVIILFILISYYAFSVARKAEQNQVWVGLSKETAHQLGTPTSSLMAWVELLRMKNVDEEITAELEKDVLRLEKIAARFSKIGSKPNLQLVNITNILQNVLSYLKTRFSDKIALNLHFPDEEIFVPINPPLFEWVIENICKNAYDAIGGKGTIDVYIRKNKHKIYIDIEDDGKGIPKTKHKTIFKPGYTTKRSGWGLGLSLSKRIVEQYHNGRIYVLNAEPDKGTAIRIALRKKIKW